MQKEILKILSEKRACTEENCALKIKISELMKHLPVSDSVDMKFSTDTSVHSSLETVKAETWSRTTSLEEPKSNVAEFGNLSECAFKVDSSLEKSLNISHDQGKDENCKSQENSLSVSSRTRTVDTSCSSIFASVSEEESEMEWKTIGDERRTSDAADEQVDDQQKSFHVHNYNKLVENYNNLKKENKTLKDKCEELESCLDMLRNEYEQCEEYWSSKLDEERKLFEEVIFFLLILS